MKRSILCAKWMALGGLLDETVQFYNINCSEDYVVVKIKYMFIAEREQTELIFCTND